VYAIPLISQELQTWRRCETSKIYFTHRICAKTVAIGEKENTDTIILLMACNSVRLFVPAVLPDTAHRPAHINGTNSDVANKYIHSI
jgi:hypothetical protein